MRRAIVVLLALGLSAAVLSATPIVYSGQLFHGIPVTGIIYQGNNQPINPVGAVYYSFYATSGASIEVFGDRLDGPFDMSFWILWGLFTDTNQFGGPVFDVGMPGFVAFGDDQDPPNIPGPYGDPHAYFTAPLTGFYTVAVTNFLSSGTPPYDFRLQANGVGAIPEPGTLGLLGIGILLLGGLARRRA